MLFWLLFLGTTEKASVAVIHAAEFKREIKAKNLIDIMMQYCIEGSIVQGLL